MCDLTCYKALSVRWPPSNRYSADVGHADLRKSNDCSQILDFRALVHAPTPHPSTAAGQTRTGARTMHAPVLRTRSGVQSSKRSGCSRAPVHRHLLRSEARRPRWWQRWSHSSLQVIDPKASAAPSWSGTMSIATARSTSDPLDGLCMLTAVLRRCSSVRLSTAVQGDIASTMHGLAMSIAAAHQCAYAVSVQTCGSSSIER